VACTAAGQVNLTPVGLEDFTIFWNADTDPNAGRNKSVTLS
jgi:hypothetical protein